MTGDQREIREDGARLLEEARSRGLASWLTTRLALMWDRVFVGVRHDLSQALRALVRTPSVTIGISLLLGLGVAATTTLFLAGFEVPDADARPFAEFLDALGYEYQREENNPAYAMFLAGPTSSS